MDDKIIIGLIGERETARYLIKNKFKVLAGNFTDYSGNEIDVIAEKKGIIHFIETKTRQRSSFSRPADFVDKRKAENIKSCAAHFMNMKKLKSEFQFDIMEVVMNGKEVVEVNLIQNAF
ncbi:MAG: YraN family protein [Acutalibacteraceae bacterium]